MSPPAWRLVLDMPAAAALALVVGVLALAVELRARRERGGAAIRAAIAFLLAASLSRPVLVPLAGSTVVVLADVSDSAPDEALARAELALGLPREGVAVLPFGDEHGTPLASAIDRGARALPGGGHVLVLTDGRATGADAVAAAAAAQRAGVRVDVVPVQADARRDAALTGLSVPQAFRPGDLLPVEATVRSSEPLSAHVRIALGEAEVVVPVSPRPGGASVARAMLPTSSGPAVVRASVEAVGDAVARNDSLSAAGMPVEPLRVLVVGEAEGAVPLADGLGASGAEATVVGPDGVPGRLSSLARWDVIALVDVSSRSLGYEQLAAVDAFVHDLGGGLLLTAGRQSFLSGSWVGTPFEDLLPLRLEPPPRGAREAVALMIVVDRSASMGTADARTGISKLDLAREAAALSTEVLHPGDTVAVVAYDDAARWVVPPAVVGAGTTVADVEAALARLETGGGTRTVAGLELGLPALAALDAPTRHAVLLSDGRDAPGDAGRHEAIVQAARDRGVTLSTIGIGFDADRPLLERLARLGRGRFHAADDPTDLPRLAVEESEITRAAGERTGPARAVLPGGRLHPALAGLDVASLPPLGGYQALQPRPGADVALVTADGDPLVAVWQYGLGRVAAWTSDAGETWAAGWLAHPAADRLWRRLAGYVARAPDAGPIRADTRLEDGRAVVSVDAVEPSGVPLGLADVVWIAAAGEDVGGAGSGRSVPTGTAGDGTPLRQVAAGRFEGAVAAAGPAPWPGVVRVSSRGGEAVTVPASVAPAADLERRPDVANVAEAVALAGGGTLLSAEDVVLPDAAPGRPRPLWPILVAVAALLWPVDVARQLRRPSRSGGPRD